MFERKKWDEEKVTERGKETNKVIRRKKTLLFGYRESKEKKGKKVKISNGMYEKLQFMWNFRT